MRAPTPPKVQSASMKVALCGALIHGPRLILLDEPFEGIDPVTSRTIKDMLDALRRKRVTLLISSHVLEIVEKLCPQVAIIDHGKLLSFGTLEQIRGGAAAGHGLEQVFLDLVGRCA